jgi:hypothetical protein
MNRDLDPMGILTHIGIVVGSLSVILVLFPSILGGGTTTDNPDNINTKLDLINYRLSSIEGDITTLRTEVSLLQNAGTNYHVKNAAGDLNNTRLLEETLTNCSISINSSLNNSTVNGRFYVYGNTGIDFRLCEAGIYRIYVVSKLGDKYWIQTEGYPDDSQNWRGYRTCLIPGNFNNTTIYAIITKEDHLIAERSDKIPEHVSISEPIYLNRQQN